MRHLVERTGEPKMEILSVLARESELRQKEIVERSSYSKGTISANVRELENDGMVEENDGNYSLNEELLLAHYREHLETFLVRKENVPETVEEVRSRLKRNMTEVLDSEKDRIIQILKDVLKDYREREDIELLNSVFKETDRRISELEENENMLMISIATDTTNSKKSRKAEKAKELVNNG